MKTFTANEYMAHTLFIQRTERTPADYHFLFTGNLKSPHCSTILIHSSCLERQRTQTVGCPTLSKFNTGKVAPF